MKNNFILLLICSMNMASGMGFLKLAVAEQAKTPVVAPAITGVSLERMVQQSIFSPLTPAHSQEIQSDKQIGLNTNEELYQLYYSMFKTGDIASLKQAAQEIKNRIDKNPSTAQAYEYRQLETIERFLQQMPCDETYLYRTINLDNPESKEFLIDKEMQRYQEMYLKGEISKLELEKKHNEIKYRNTGWLDFHSQRTLKRRLSFIRRILNFAEQVKKNPSYGLQQGRRVSYGFNKRGFASNISSRVHVYSASPSSSQSSSQSVPPANPSQEPILEHMLLSDLNHPLHEKYDSLLTMVQIEHPEMFGEYKAALDPILNSIDYSKLDAGSFDSYSQAMKYAFKQYFHHMQPTNPLKHPKDFLVNTAKYVGWWALNISCGNAGLALEKAGLVCSQIYELSSADYSQMTSKERIDMIAQRAADITWAIATNKVMQKTQFSKTFICKVGKANSPTTGSSSSSSVNNAHSAESPQTVTPEGVVFKAEQLSPEYSAAQKTVNSSTSMQQIVKEEIDASTPVGRAGNPLNVVAKNSPITIDGVKFTGHALDQMQARGVLTPSAVLDVVKNPAHVSPGNKPGTQIFLRDNLKVVMNEAGDIITVILQ